MSIGHHRHFWRQAKWYRCDYRVPKTSVNSPLDIKGEGYASHTLDINGEFMPPLGHQEIRSCATHQNGSAGFDYDVAFGSLPFAFGYDLRVVGECHVDDSAFFCRHGF